MSMDADELGEQIKLDSAEHREMLTDLLQVTIARQNEIAARLNEIRMDVDSLMDAVATALETLNQHGLRHDPPTTGFAD